MILTEHPTFERKFDILDSNGERLFIAAETKGTRNSVRCGRKLYLTLLSSNGSEILKFNWTSGVSLIMIRIEFNKN